MNIEQIFQDKSIKAKEKVTTIGDWLLKNELSLEELLVFADNRKASDKATCIEAVEYATKKQPAIADESLLAYVTDSLKHDEPRVKWESAKVIGNIAKLFPDQVQKSILNLLLNADPIRQCFIESSARMRKMLSAVYYKYIFHCISFKLQSKIITLFCIIKII